VTIRLYEGRMEFDYDSSDGTVKTTHTVYVESDGLYFDGKIYGTGSPGVIISSPVSSDSSGLETGDFEFQSDQIAFGTNTLYAKADGSGVIFSGTIGATLDSTPAPAAQGTVAGFASGGFQNFPTPGPVVDIEKYPFSISSGTATDVGDLNEPRTGSTGLSSTTDGFAIAGTNPAGAAVPGYISTIDKFPFGISAGTATNVGNLTDVKSFASSQLSSANGFVSGGFTPGGSSSYLSIIEKLPFSISSGTAADIGDLSSSRTSTSGQNSSVDGYTSGGYEPPSVAPTSTIDKFPFGISSGTAINVGDLSEAKYQTTTGQSSKTDGFTTGGVGPVSPLTTIEKYPFSISSGTATDVGDLGPGADQRSAAAGSSSTTDAFTAGGLAPPYATDIYKFPFSISSGTSTNVGDLSIPRGNISGQQD